MVETTPEANKFVVVTLKPVALAKLMLPALMVPVFNVVMVPVVALSTVVLKAVVVALVNVALFAIKFCNNVSPRTVRVEVTVEDEAKKPAYKSNVFVAEAPMLVTWANEGVPVPAGQFVPLAKQTN